MGFGSYDESEQKDQNVETDDEDAVNVHQNDNDGEVTFETEKSTDELVDQLQHMKSQDDDD
ncbi:DUF5786 family protein [Halorientalis brevis]|uniref:DUF5786 family protein n=1 Tax=Halorientalis brevis TaxID=1126241 RepID=A0ABD6C9W0_9EURY|nr:DUF5786 family protein [Halorientalis brevis]